MIASIITGKWPVEADYEIATVKVFDKNVRIVRPVDFSRGRLLDPTTDVRLARKFSEIRDEKDLLKFVRQFGLLGHDRLWPKQHSGGDPVDWALRHATRVSIAFQIIHLIERGPTDVAEELQSVLHGCGIQLMGPTTTGDELERSLFQGTGKMVLRPDKSGKPKLKEALLIKIGAVYHADWPRDPVRVAWYVLSQMINDGIRGLHLEVSEESLVPKIAFGALIQLIYWQLAAELRGLNPHVCVGCGRFFAGRADAETCSNRCRMKKSRMNKSSKKAKRRKR